MPYNLQRARQAAADLEREVADLRARDESGRFVTEAEPADPLGEALASMRRQQDLGLARVGIRPPASPASSNTPKAPPDFGGGNRGQPSTPAGPSMNDALMALLRDHRGY